MQSVFVVPVIDQWLLHAPLHSTSALVNSAAVERLGNGRSDREHGELSDLQDLLLAPDRDVPTPAEGPPQPEFLGLIPTRDCNLDCVYCGFAADESGHETMDLFMAAEAVERMAELASGIGRRTLEVHFFGGEPFFAPDVVDVAVHCARASAARLGLVPRFEAATNGFFSKDRCRFVGSYFDSVVLSLDGPEDIQNRNRPRKNGGGSYSLVAENARMLSRSPVELFIRTCVTADSVAHLPRITRWFCDSFRPSAIVLEPLQPSGRSAACGLEPPDPYEFAVAVMRSAAVAAPFGIDIIYAPASTDVLRHSLCPVGRDTFIVSPDGRISACYLLEREWTERGLDLNLGRLNGTGELQIDAAAVERVRKLTLDRPRCRRCFARWHCAGGCQVNHCFPGCPNSYDAFCIQTRIITACRLLESLGCREQVDRLLAAPAAMEKLALQASDELQDWGALDD